MKFTFLLLLISVIQATAGVYSQTENVTLDVNNASLESILSKMEKQTGYTFLYSIEDVESVEKKDVKVIDMSLFKVLDSFLSKTNLKYNVVDRTVVILPKSKAERTNTPQDVQQKIKTVTGMVRDVNGVPLPGVSVVVKGTNTGVATDIDGKFIIDIKDSKDVVLVLSFVGMKTQEVVLGEKTSLKVVMKDDSEQLEEVVCTGYQTISKERTTGSFEILDNEVLDKKVTSDIASKLEGMVAGLEYDRGKMTIRGISSLRAGAEPLIVLDGYPLNADISTINPKDIEQVTVLKDAAAASIWGARAANGVIVITTKRAKSDKLSYSFSTSVTTRRQAALDNEDILSGKDLIALQRSLFDEDHPPYFIVKDNGINITSAERVFYQMEEGEITKEEGEKKLADLAKLNNDKQIRDLTMQNPLMVRSDLSVSGREKNHNFLISGNFTYNKSDAKYQENNSYNVLFKDEIEFNNKLTVNLGMNFNHYRDNSSPIDNSRYIARPQYEMLLDDEGNQIPVYLSYRSQDILDELVADGFKDETINPIRERKQILNDHVKNNTRLQFGFKYDILSSLNLSVKYQYESGYDTKIKHQTAASYEAKKLYNMFTVAGENGERLNLIPEGDIIDTHNQKMSSYNLRAQLNFNKTFNDIHSVSAIAGAERSKTVVSFKRDRELGVNNLNTVLVDEKDLAKRSGKSLPKLTWMRYYPDRYKGLGETDNRFVSFYTNLGYTYNGRYSLTASARVDQSNLFGTDKKNRYKPLWSVGGKWLVSEEDFFQNDIVSYLSLRASIGTGGNIAKNVGKYLLLNSVYNSTMGQTSNKILFPPNDKLKWETTRTYNAGIDMAVLNNRVDVKLDYYYKKSFDLLAPLTIDPLTGFESSTVNAGIMENKGFEFTLNTRNIERENFTWGTSLNLAYNKNNLTKVEYSPTSAGAYFSSPYFKGKPFGAVYAYKYGGLTEDGEPQVYDKDGNLTTVFTDNAEDLKYQGTFIPPYTGGMTNFFTYKNFDFSFLIVYKGGHVMRSKLTPISETVSSRVTARLKDRWMKAGDHKTKTIPKYTLMGEWDRDMLWEFSDANVFSADYLKLQNLNVSYNFDERICKKLKVSGASLGLQVDNIYTWYNNKLDQDPSLTSPEGNLMMPERTSYTLSLNIKF